MYEDLVPGFVLLRALYAVVKGGHNREPELRLAVNALCIRARDAKAERQFLDKQPEWAKGELVGPLEQLEGVCRDFDKALEIYLLERLPDEFIYPPDTLIAAAAAAVVAGEFRVACARANIDEKEDDHGNRVH